MSNKIKKIGSQRDQAPSGKNDKKVFSTGVYVQKKEAPPTVKTSKAVGVVKGIRTTKTLAHGSTTQPILTGPKAITANSKLELMTVTPCENVTVNTLLVTVQAFAVGVISYALQRGFGQQVIDPSGAFYAYVYIVNMLTSAMRNATPTVQYVPMFFKKVLDSVKPKRIAIGAGSVGYVWTTNFDPLSTDYEYNCGPGTSARSWNVGNVGTTVINDFLHVIDPPSAYSEPLGERAWTILLQFLAELENKSDTKMVNYMGGVDTKYMNDASAFAVCDQILGTSGSTNGGYIKNNECEVPIVHPLYACFASNGANTLKDPYRSPMYSVIGAGDACTLGGVKVSGFNEKLDRSRIPMIFKSVDFNRFVDVIGRWMAKVAQEAYDDEQVFQHAWASDADYLTCGLTFQEFKILLRNILMNAFQDSQFFVQNNIPGDSLNITNNFLPFISGQGTCPVEATNAQFPAYFIENIRSLTVRSQRLENPFTVVPVLGQYEEDLLDDGDYVYTSLTEPRIGPIRVFAPAPTVQVLNEKTKKLEKVNAETTISMVDGQFGGGYAVINSPYALNNYANLWNDWINKIKPFTSSLSTLGKDGGIAGLQVTPFTDLTFTNVQMPDGSRHPSMIPTKHSYVDRKLPDRFKKRTLGIQNYYSDRLIEATTCSQAPIANVWQLTQSFWIKPEMPLWGTGNTNEKNSVSKWQAFSREYNAIKYTPGDDNSSLQQQHDQYATSMAKARNGEDNMSIRLVADMELKGRGGIFASVLGGMGSIAVNLLSQPGVIKGITNMIPF